MSIYTEDIQKIKIIKTILKIKYGNYYFDSRPAINKALEILHYIQEYKDNITISNKNRYINITFHKDTNNNNIHINISLNLYTSYSPTWVVKNKCYNNSDIILFLINNNLIYNP